MDYKELDDLIEQLKEAVEEGDPQKGYWKELWALVKRIGAGFKGTHYPSNEDKNKAWSRFQELREQASARSESDRARVEEQKKEWEKRKERSLKTRSKVEGKSTQARPLSSLERGVGNIILAPLLLIEAILRDIFGLEKLDQIKDELLNCNAKMREAWELFNTHKGDLLPGDKAQTYKSLIAAQERLDRAWADWKARNNEFYEAKKEAWKRKQREYEEKHQQFVERVEANISKLESRLGKAKTALERQETHLDKLRGDYANAWSDGFRERCSEWIDECEGKIADIKADIEKVEAWIDEERAKLR